MIAPSEQQIIDAQQIQGVFHFTSANFICPINE